MVQRIGFAMKTIADYAMFTGARCQFDYEFAPKCRSNPKSYPDWVGFGVVDGMLTMVTANTTITASLYGDSGGNTARADYVTRLYLGDQRAKLIGTETQTHVPASDPAYGVFAWSETSWAADGTLNNGVAEENFNDVITGSAENDDIQGKGGSDALSGGEGNDKIDGGAGNDLIAGGRGSNTILGGAGNDYIVGSGTMAVPQRNKPGDAWTPPAGKQLVYASSTWGLYNEPNAVVGAQSVWSGITDTGTGSEANTIDGGEGDDTIIAGHGNDRIQGGTGNDTLTGLEGDNILEGGEGSGTHTLTATPHEAERGLHTCTRRVPRRRCIATKTVAKYQALTGAAGRFDWVFEWHSCDSHYRTQAC